MKNIYDGIVALDANGKAEIKLPAWFEELNGDFRYQLTAIRTSGPDLYLEQEIVKNHFKIAGGKPGMKVSWQVTGIRKDPWAKAHQIEVEPEKPSKERGYYLNPELFNESPDKSIEWARHPDKKQHLKRLHQIKNEIKRPHESKNKLGEHSDFPNMTYSRFIVALLGIHLELVADVRTAWTFASDLCLSASILAVNLAART